MPELPSIGQLQQMADDEVAALNRKLAKRAMRNLAIFVGLKVAIAYGLHRWAKSVAENG